MKKPKYFINDVQEAINIGINGFAFQLLGESYANILPKIGKENVVIKMYDHHTKKDIWMIVTETMPTAKDFDPEEEYRRI